MCSDDPLKSTPWETIAVDEPEPQFEPATVPPSHRRTGGALTIPVLCLGIGIIACCLLVPTADENRRLAYEAEKLKADLAQLQQQVQTNDEFLKRVASDPALAERLARRQMKMVREGTSVMELDTARGSSDMSPFSLVAIPPPPEMPEYQPVAGKLTQLCLNPRVRLYTIGTGLLLLAAGLVLSSSPPRCFTPLAAVNIA